MLFILLLGPATALIVPGLRSSLREAPTCSQHRCSLPPNAEVGGAAAQQQEQEAGQEQHWHGNDGVGAVEGGRRGIWLRARAQMLQFAAWLTQSHANELHLHAGSMSRLVFFAAVILVLIRV